MDRDAANPAIVRLIELYHSMPRDELDDVADSETIETTMTAKGSLPFLVRVALAVCLATVLIFVLGLTTLFLFLWVVHHRYADWLINLVGLTLVSGAVVVFWRTMRTLARCRYRFSLRASLVGMAVLGLAFAILGNQLRVAVRQSQAHWVLWRQGGAFNVAFAYPVDSGWFNWLIKHVGFDPFGKVVDVDARTDGALDAFVEHKAEFVDVKTLFFGPGVTDRGLTHAAELNQFPSLTNANFHGSNITDAGLEYLADWKNLRWLQLDRCWRITDMGLAHLVDLPDIEGLLWSQSGKIGLTDAGLLSVGRMSRLRSLGVDSIAISDAGLAHLRGLSCLERLTIGGANITDAGLQHITGLSIMSLTLAGTSITDVGAEQLVQMTQLETLDFRGPGIGDKALLRLQKLPKLKSLVLDNTNVTDDGLQHLQAMGALERLFLSGPAFTDAGLQHLHSVRSLRRLAVSSRQINPGAVEALRAALPKCRIDVR
jgi:hypothetical protein